MDPAHLIHGGPHNASPGLQGDCVFCPGLRFELNRLADLPTGLLWANRDVFVIVDVAPLAEGHVLVVAVDHYPCGGACPAAVWQRAVEARRSVDRIYRTAYGRGATFFEHGPARSQGAGSCIDHAHWHCLPAGFDVRGVVEGYGLRGTRVTRPHLTRYFHTGASYLYLEQDGQSWAYLADELPNQFLRWATTTALEGPGPVWRWQEMYGLPEYRNRFLATRATMRSMYCSGQPPI